MPNVVTNCIAELRAREPTAATFKPLRRSSFVNACAMPPVPRMPQPMDCVSDPVWNCERSLEPNTAPMQSAHLRQINPPSFRFRLFGCDDCLQRPKPVAERGQDRRCRVSHVA